VGTDEEDSFADVLNGFSLDSRRRPRPVRPAASVPAAPEIGVPQEIPVEEDNASMVRAYAWTGGRTRSDFQLEIETLVATSVRGLDEAVSSEHQEIADLCQESKSVAEVAALLRLPLGVVKVLLGDMAMLGLIIVYETDVSPDMELLERVLRGLTNLRS
jgi:uncharacterized protein DUF742